MDDKSRDPPSFADAGGCAGRQDLSWPHTLYSACTATCRRGTGREWRVLRTGASNATSHAGTTGLGNTWYCFSLARNEQSHNEQGRVWHSDTRFNKSLFIKALLPDKGRVRVQMSDLTLAAPATHALMLIGARSMCTI